MTRREVLRLMGVGAVAGTTGRLCFGQSRSFMPDVELALRAGGGDARILPGPATRVWRFTGEVLKGPPQSLEVIPDSYLGPILRLRKGQKVRIRFTNALPEPSIVHWHGMDMPSAMDGHPHSVIDPQNEFIYEFEVTNRAGTYWYHPHPHNRTGPQVYNGLAGLLLVSDAEERALNLPSGPEEIVCVLQDRSFDAANQLIYVSGGMGGMMEHAQGFLGDRMLVNGSERPSFALATRAYRLRSRPASRKDHASSALRERKGRSSSRRSSGITQSAIAGSRVSALTTLPSRGGSSAILTRWHLPLRSC